MLYSSRCNEFANSIIIIVQYVLGRTIEIHKYILLNKYKSVVDRKTTQLQSSRFQEIGVLMYALLCKFLCNTHRKSSTLESQWRGKRSDNFYYIYMKEGHLTKTVSMPSGDRLRWNFGNGFSVSKYLRKPPIVWSNLPSKWTQEPFYQFHVIWSQNWYWHKCL